MNRDSQDFVSGILVVIALILAIVSFTLASINFIKKQTSDEVSQTEIVSKTIVSDEENLLEFKKQAVVSGLAKWVVDEYGNTTFEWIQNEGTE
jgi:hypothetical protein